MRKQYQYRTVKLTLNQDGFSDLSIEKDFNIIHNQSVTFIESENNFKTNHFKELLDLRTCPKDLADLYPLRINAGTHQMGGLANSSFYLTYIEWHD